MQRKRPLVPKRIRDGLLAFLMRDHLTQFAEVEEATEPPKRHFQWKIPADVRVTGWNVPVSPDVE